MGTRLSNIPTEHIVVFETVIETSHTLTLSPINKTHRKRNESHWETFSLHYFFFLVMNSPMIFEPFDVHTMFANSVFCVSTNFPSDMTLKTFIGNYTPTLGFTCRTCLASLRTSEGEEQKPQTFIVVGNTAASRKVFYHMLMSHLPVRMLLSKNSEKIDEQYTQNTIRLNLDTDEEVREFSKTLCLANIEMVPNTSNVIFTACKPLPLDKKKFGPKMWTKN